MKLKGGNKHKTIAPLVIDTGILYYGNSFAKITANE